MFLVCFVAAMLLMIHSAEQVHLTLDLGPTRAMLVVAYWNLWHKWILQTLKQKVREIMFDTEAA